MLTHPTLDLLRTLNLDGMADAFTELQGQDAAKDLSHAEWLGLLLDREAANRNTNAQASVEDVDYRAARQLDKALFQQLASCRWIAEHRNLLVTGPCGVGKSWLSCALAQKACRDGYTVHYARVPRLFADLELAHGDGRFAKLFRTLTKADLLILDDWGPERLNPNQRRDLMEIVEDRYGSGSTLITSQLTVDKWHDVIGEPTFADAILDRLIHNAYRPRRPVDTQAPGWRRKGSGGGARRPCGDDRGDRKASKGSPEMTTVPNRPPLRGATPDSRGRFAPRRGCIEPAADKKKELPTMLDAAAEH
jgi:DNA replication protein DnaC